MNESVQQQKISDRDNPLIHNFYNQFRVHVMDPYVTGTGTVFMDCVDGVDLPHSQTFNGMKICQLY